VDHETILADPPRPRKSHTGIASRDRDNSWVSVVGKLDVRHLRIYARINKHKRLDTARWQRLTPWQRVVVSLYAGSETRYPTSPAEIARIVAPDGGGKWVYETLTRALVKLGVYDRQKATWS
jgi:hypothetical protein